MKRLAEVYTDTYSMVWKDMDIGECSNMTNWTSQTDIVTTGRRLYALRMDNAVPQLKSA